MIGLKVHTEYDDFCSFIMRLDQQLIEWKYLSKNKASSSSSSSGFQSKTKTAAVKATVSGDAMDWTATIAALSPQNRQKIVAALQPNKPRKPEGKIGSDEWIRRRKDKKCNDCGKLGHLARDHKDGKPPTIDAYNVVAAVETEPEEDSENDEPFA